MAINNNYEYNKENELLYNTDGYVVNSGTSIDFIDGTVRLKNASTNYKSENFYGDGRLGNFVKSDNNIISIRSLYFTEIQNHPLHGPCLYNIWYDSVAGLTTANMAEFEEGDELFIIKKHVKEVENLGEYGDWDIVTLTNMVQDDDGTHYCITEMPETLYTENTANAAQLVLQYESFEIRDGYNFNVRLNSTVVITNPHWGKMVSLPNTNLFIKSQKGIKLGNNCTMSNEYGHCGSHHYYYYRSGTSQHLPGGPLGPGITNVITSDITLPNPLSYATPGGPGLYGFNQNADTNTCNPLANIDDLNNKLYPGSGGSVKYVNQSQSYGFSGGGIVQLQTTDIEIGQNSYISTQPGTTGAVNVDHSSANGGMLIKCNNLKIVGVEDITLSGSPSLNDLKNYTTSTNAETGAEIITYGSYKDFTRFKNASIVSGWISTPNIFQIEFNNLIIDEIVHGFDDVVSTPTLLSNLIESTYIQEIQNSIGLQSPEDWDVSTYNYDLSHSGPFYETGKYYKVYTKGFHNVETSLWESLNGMNIEASVPNNTDVRFLLSRDGGDTWFKLNPASNNFSAVTLTNIGNGNTKEELEAYTNNLILTNSLVISSADKTIDVAVGLKTNNSSVTPSVDYFTFSYDGIEVPDAPVRILPYHEEEFDKEEVDFVWLQPMQANGSLQNRIEISPTSNFSPNEDIIDIPVSDYSNTGDSLHIPYASKQVDNKINNLSDLLLPYILVKGVTPESTYDEKRSSAEFDLISDKIKYHGDTFLIKGKSTYISGGQELSIPNINNDAPLRSTVDSGISGYYRMSGSTMLSQDNFSGSGAFSSFTPSDVLVKENYYLDRNSYFNGSATVGMFIPAASKRSHPLLKRYTERTLHIKFKLDTMINTYTRLWTIRRDVTSTDMMYIDIYSNYINVNGAKSTDTNNTNYAEYTGTLYGKEQNITVVIDQFERAKVYLNGYCVIEDVQCMNYLNYIDDENDSDEDSVDAFDISAYIGNHYANYGSYSTVGAVHEVVLYNHAKTPEEVLEISKLPNYHLRYDLRDEQLKLLQIPYEQTEFMNENELFNVNLNNPNRQISHFTPTALSSFENHGYLSNNETLLLGKFYPETYKKDSFAPTTNDKHIILGYNWYTNDWPGVSSLNHFTINSNNSLEQSYTTSDTIFVKPGRINKHNTNTEIEFVYNIDERSRTTVAQIGIRYGLYSAGNTTRNYFNITRNTDLSITLNCYMYGLAAWSKTLTDFEPGHRYTLSVIPVDGSFNSNVLVKLYSATNLAYENPVTLYSSGIDQGFNTSNRGYETPDYDDLTEIDGIGDWIDVGAGVISMDSEFALIGLTCSDNASNVTRENGYVSDYFIEKKLPAGLTYNIIRMDITSIIPSALTTIKTIISFDSGVTWRSYNADTRVWSTLGNIEIDTIKSNGMLDADLYAITDSVAEVGGFVLTEDTIMRTYLMTDSGTVSPSIISYKVLKNGPRIIDSWDEAGSYYRSEYDWHYLNNGSWNPYLEIDTTGGTGQSWKEFGNNIPSPTVFIDGNGSKPSTNLLKTYGHVKIDCLPKGKWYWRISAYNGLKK